VGSHSPSSLLGGIDHIRPLTLRAHLFAEALLVMRRWMLEVLSSVLDSPTKLKLCRLEYYSARVNTIIAMFATDGYDDTMIFPEIEHDSASNFDPSNLHFSSQNLEICLNQCSKISMLHSRYVDISQSVHRLKKFAKRDTYSQRSAEEYRLLDQCKLTQEQVASVVNDIFTVGFLQWLLQDSTPITSIKETRLYYALGTFQTAAIESEQNTVEMQLSDLLKDILNKPDRPLVIFLFNCIFEVCILLHSLY
jgi:hypothetical protein